MIEKTQVSGYRPSFESISNIVCFKNEKVNRVAVPLLKALAIVVANYLALATIGMTATLLINLSLISVGAVGLFILKYKNNDNLKRNIN